MDGYVAPDGCIDLSCKYQTPSPMCDTEMLAGVGLSLAKFFYSSGIPFNMVENADFINFVANLNPNYELPSKTSLASVLVEDVHVRIKNYEEATWPSLCSDDMPLNLCQPSSAKVQGRDETTKPDHRGLYFWLVSVFVLHQIVQCTPYIFRYTYILVVLINQHTITLS